MPISRRIALSPAFALAGSILTLALTPAAQARPTVITSQPNEGSAISKPTSLDITFSQPVAQHALSVSLMMTSMPGMAHQKPMPIKGFAITTQGQRVSLRFPRPLPIGTYELDWRIAGTTASETAGSLKFRVK